MPDRHDYDDFLRALIFSLIINLLIIIAILAQQRTKKPVLLQTVVVSIEEHHPASHSEFLEKPPMMKVSPHPARAMNRAKHASLLPQRAGIDPDLSLLQESSVPPLLPEETSSSLPATERLENASVVSNKPAASSLRTEIKIPGGDDTAPEYLSGENPPYPKRAQRNGWEGAVLLTLLISSTGGVEMIEIIKTSGYEILDRQACESVRNWRFKPATRHGVPLAVTVQQEIIFRTTPPGNDQ